MTSSGPKRITVELTHDGIADAIKQMKIVRAMTKTNCVLFRIEVAKKIEEIAQDLYSMAWYNDIVGGERMEGENLPVMWTSIENTEEYTALVVNNDIAVFIEFGAGVYHNGPAFSSPHPWGSELGFTIGSYPEHKVPSKGVNPSWDTGEGYATRGTEAQLVLWRAVKMVDAYLEDIAKEVFKYD